MTRARLQGALASLALALAACAPVHRLTHGGRAGGAGAGLAAAFAAATAAASPAAPPLAPLRAEGDRLVDPWGGTVILRGANYSERSKRPPFVGWMRPEDFLGMREAGFDAVRFLLTWEAIEPVAGSYDAAYLDEVGRALDWAHAHGVHVLLDMHQDMWSRDFGGDGAPRWATDDHALVPNAPVGFPLNYLNPDVVGNFTRFWRDPARQAPLVRAWGEVVRRFRSHPAVVGYDLFNEPFPGLVPLFETRELPEFYDRVIAEVRRHDPERPIFIEPGIAVGGGLPTLLRRPRDPHLVYAPHYYDPTTAFNIFTLGTATNIHSSGYDGGRWRAAAAFDLARWQARRLDAPLVLGEWGIDLGSSRADDYLEDQLSLVEERLMGALLWDWDAAEPHAMSPVDVGGVPKPALDRLARPYPRRTAGRLLAYRYEPRTERLELRFEELRPAVPGATEIAVSTLRYRGGLVVESSDPPGAWRWEHDLARAVVRIWSDPSRGLHTLVVRPR
ncbi:MAG: cellulase family glycosylhydrolase [Planctomycetes bacterium]|nr:cellulase family glycosylhydrolase [Planctomycetota bacterium]